MFVDVVLWSNEYVMKWVESIGLGDYATNLYESGVHGGVIALDNDFDVEKLAFALKIPQSHSEVSSTDCNMGSTLLHTCPYTVHSCTYTLSIVID